MEEMSADVPLPPAGRRVGIVFNPKKGDRLGTPDAEAEYDNIETVCAIRDALRSGGFDAVPLEGDGTLPEAILKTPVDIVFNIAEGLRGRGREAEIPALMNLLNIPFTGSDETALCVSLDKAMCKRLLSTYGVRTPGFAVVAAEAELDALDLRFPVIVKPNAEGSSKGVTEACVVRTPEALRSLVCEDLRLYGEPMLVEEYLDGREFTVGILGNGDNTRVFPAMEIIFRGNTQGDFRVYSYGVKQDYKKYIDYKSPADIPAAAETEMRGAALCVYRALGCHDCARVDFRMDAEGRPYFIEINPLPGLAPGYSDFPMLAEFAGVSYNELVLGILHAALSRLGIEAAKK